MFSATLPPEALEITRKFMNKPVSAQGVGGARVRQPQQQPSAAQGSVRAAPRWLATTRGATLLVPRCPARPRSAFWSSAMS